MAVQIGLNIRHQRANAIDIFYVGMVIYSIPFHINKMLYYMYSSLDIQHQNSGH